MSLRTVASFAGAFGAFDAKHVELTLDVTKDEITPHDSDNITRCVGDRRFLMPKQPAQFS
jgi:hypothetical protein